MIAVTVPELLAALIITFIIGGGGFLLGVMTGTDRADQRHAARQLEARPRPAPRYDPGDPWRTGPRPVIALAADDTAPLRRVPAFIVGHGGFPAPAALETAIQLAAYQTELEIRDLIRAAEQKIGFLYPAGS